MPHLKGKEIPIFVDDSIDGPRVPVGTALVVHHDPTAVEFYVRLEDAEFVNLLRASPVQGLFFEISRPIPIESAKPLEYPIEIVGHSYAGPEC